MKLTVIIPVSGDISDDIAGDRAALTPLLAPDTKLEFVGLDRGFPTIESEVQALVNGAEVLREAAAAFERGSDGVFVNCFDDPAVFAMLGTGETSGVFQFESGGMRRLLVQLR